MKLELNGKTLSYRRAGSGPPILWIHAFPFSRLMWEVQLATFAPTNTCVALDLPGFGGSTALAESKTTVASYAEACEAVAQQVNPKDPWIIAGLSLGGYVAFEILRRRKLKLRGLILADTRADADTPEQTAGRRAALARARTAGSVDVAESLLGKMVTDSCPTEVRDMVRAWMKATPKDGLLGAMNALITRPDSMATLDSIRGPALLLVGDDDLLTPPSGMETIARHLKTAKLVRIANAAHLSNVEQPEPFNGAVKEWLEGLGKGKK